jgi:cell division protein ZapA
MPTVRILNRDYQIACGDGEEKKLLALASRLNKRLEENARLFKGASENLIIILTALTLEDFTQDLDQQNLALEKQLAQALNSATQAIDEQLGEAADRIENIIKKL